jgi:hypothetical protein
MPPKKKTEQLMNFGFDQQVNMATPVVAAQQSTQVSVAAVPVQVKAQDNDRMQLAASINNLVLRGEQFASAVESLKNFSSERLVQLDMQISSKKQEYSDLLQSLDNEYKIRGQQMENEYKNRQIKLKQELDEFGLSMAEKVLSLQGLTPVIKEDYQALQTEMTQLKSKIAVEMSQAVAAEAQKWKQDKDFALQSRDLQHKAEIASLTAEVEQQKKEIAMLNSQLSNMKAEIAAQRELTKEVAQAGAKAQISQNFAGSK